jgi:hypothetical protein
MKICQSVPTFTGVLRTASDPRGEIGSDWRSCLLKQRGIDGELTSALKKFLAD